MLSGEASEETGRAGQAHVTKSDACEAGPPWFHPKVMVSRGRSQPEGWPGVLVPWSAHLGGHVENRLEARRPGGGYSTNDRKTFGSYAEATRKVTPQSRSTHKPERAQR